MPASYPLPDRRGSRAKDRRGDDFAPKEKKNTLIRNFFLELSVVTSAVPARPSEIGRRSINQFVNVAFWLAKNHPARNATNYGSPFQNKIYDFIIEPSQGEKAVGRANPLGESAVAKRTSAPV